MEKRKHRRVPFDRIVNVTSASGKEYRFSAIDFSMSGIGLHCKAPPVRDELLNLRFHIMPRGKARELSVKGYIRHMHFTADGYKLGISFLETE